MFCPVKNTEKRVGEVYAVDTDSMDLGNLLNVLESLEIDSYECFKDIPIQGFTECHPLSSSSDGSSDCDDDGSESDDWGLVNGGLFLS